MGQVQILEDYGYQHSRKNRMGTMKCGYCGKVFYGRIRKDRKSCGCMRGATHGEERGKKKSPELKSWSQMKYRCSNINCSDYPNYGGRGITYCERWEQFSNFLEDMGRRPGNNYSLERIDVNGNYEPNNCRWATKIEQARNKRNNNFIQVDEQTKTLSEWISIANISRTHFYRLRRSGMLESDIIKKYLGKGV